MGLKAGLLRTAFALSLALTPAVSAYAGTDSSEKRSAAADSAISNIKIENFGRVSSTFFRGSQPMGRDYADLAALGIKVIIDLQSDDAESNEAELAKAAGLEYYNIKMNTHTAPTADQLATFFKLVTDPTKPVYLHCRGGRHRTGVMTAAYRMSFEGWTPAQAFAEMKKYNFGADFLHPEFKKYVMAYDIKTSPATVVAASQQ
jgi:tyrosine-protein phosphatase SIW14